MFQFYIDLFNQRKNRSITFECRSRSALQLNFRGRFLCDYNVTYLNFISVLSQFYGKIVYLSVYRQFDLSALISDNSIRK